MIKIQTLATASVMTAAFAMAPAFAGGSIGGDCCADLEERVAELEATTVRKGNRKVSLKLSGHVNKALVFGGSEQLLEDPAIIDNYTSRSRFRLTGKAKISSDLYAGYAIELQLGAGRIGDSGGEGIFSELRRNEIWLGSKTLGKLSIGKGSAAGDQVTRVDLSGTNYTSGGSLSFLSLADIAGGNGDVFLDNNSSRTERVRYDTPTIAGFKFSASWEDNEDFDLAARFAAGFGDFKFAAAVGYYENGDLETVAGSAALLHVPTGLNVSFSASDVDGAGPSDRAQEHWYLQGGIKQKVFAAGTTAFSVGYGEHTAHGGDEGERFNVGLTQNVDAAAMSLYLRYEDVEIEARDYDESVFVAGAIIKF